MWTFFQSSARNSALVIFTLRSLTKTIKLLLIPQIPNILHVLSTTIVYAIDLDLFFIPNIFMKKVTSSQFLLLQLLALWFTSLAFGANTTQPEEGMHMVCVCVYTPFFFIFLIILVIKNTTIYRSTCIYVSVN